MSKPAFQPLKRHNNHRVIDPYHNPENIAVILADSMAEAIHFADRKLRQDGIQGVVWWREPDPNANENAFRLMKAFEERSGLQNSLPDNYPPPSVTQMQSMLFYNSIEKNWSTTSGDRAALHDLFSDQARDDISGANSLLNLKVFPEMSFQLKRKRDLHLDSGNQIIGQQNTQPNKIFQGIGTAAIMAQTIAGTLIASPDSVTYKDTQEVMIDQSFVNDSWMVGLNSWLFFHPYWTELGLEKALVHSMPYFAIDGETLSPENPPRLFHRIDFEFK